jgi:hypothetical protein
MTRPMTLLPSLAPPEGNITSSNAVTETARLVGVWASRARDVASQRRRDRWFTAIVVGLSMAVFLRSLMPGIGYSGDVAKWQYMSVTGGIPHATGYPLWTALIQAWGKVLPWGSPARATSLLSAVIGAMGIGVLFQLLRTLNVRRTVAAATALTFAVTPTFWAQASVAEVYTLHVLFLASITLCLARWRLGGGNWWLLSAMAIFSLALGHHMMIMLALPGMAWLVWSDRQRALTWGNGVWVALFVVLGASQYLYLLYMNDVGGYVEVPTHDLAGLWDLLRGGEFKDEMWAFGAYQYLEARLPLLGEIVGREYLLLQAPIAYGIWHGLWSERPLRDISIHLLLLGLLSTVFATNYDVFDVEVFFLPLLFVLAVFLGLGLERAIVWAHERYPGHQRVVWGVALGLLALPVVVGLADYRRSSQRGNLADAARIEEAIGAAGENAVFITDSYPDEQYFSYYLLAEDLGDERNLAVAGRLNEDDVRDYFRGRPGDVWDAVNSLDGVEIAPLITAGRHQATELRADGFQLTKLGDSVWRVDAGPRPGSSSDHDESSSDEDEN